MARWQLPLEKAPALMQQEMQHFATALGQPLNSQTQATQPGKPIPASAQEFSAILAAMEPEKVRRLMEILSSYEDLNRLQANLAHLYEESETPYAQWIEFLNNHNVTRLGAASQDAMALRAPKYVFSTLDGTESFILNLESRLGASKEVADHLSKRSLKTVCAWIGAERQISITGDDGPETCSLLVSEFSSQGDLKRLGEKAQPEFPTEQRLQSALTIYSKMAKILCAIQQDGCGFPDMKNSNWLLDENNELLITDTKAFVQGQELNGRLCYNSSNSLMSSPQLTPPELARDGVDFSLDQMHAYMLGKNIYQFLSGCSDAYLKTGKSSGSLFSQSQLNEGERYDFSAPVFNSPIGRHLQELIKDLVKENPQERLPLAQALQRLSTLNQIQDLATKLSTQLQGETQKHLFAAYVDDGLSHSENPEQLEQLKQHLEDFKHLNDLINEAPQLKHSSTSLMARVGQFKQSRDIINSVADLKKAVSSLSSYDELREGLAPQLSVLRSALSKHSDPHAKNLVQLIDNLALPPSAEQEYTQARSMGMR